ncbi:MAG TPA: hypothetical protein PKC43_09725 [Phycisphaerales bacterium]|nr:hypothetical protein [Phycisphaerales bacterium]HMP37713.1 hypothetical protein [Phycisphaerales bacterium]
MTLLAPFSVTTGRPSPQRTIGRRRACGTLLAALLAATTCLIAAPLEALAQEATPGESAPLPATPAAVTDIVLMRPFLLEEPYVSDWSAERPTVGSGWLVVIAADPSLLRPRQTQEPILLVGAVVAERLNFGVVATDAGVAEAAGAVGHVVAIVPAELIAGAAPAGAPRVAPILVDRPAFFGTPGLPEAVTRAMGEAELASAVAAGLAAPSEAARDAAAARGGDLLRLADRSALLAAAAQLVRTWSPAERDRALELEGAPLVDSPAAP